MKKHISAFVFGCLGLCAGFTLCYIYIVVPEQNARLMAVATLQTLDRPTGISVTVMSSTLGSAHRFARNRLAGRQSPPYGVIAFSGKTLQLEHPPTYPQHFHLELENEPVWLSAAPLPQRKDNVRFYLDSAYKFYESARYDLARKYSQYVLDLDPFNTLAWKLQETITAKQHERNSRFRDFDTPHEKRLRGVPVLESI